MYLILGISGLMAEEELVPLQEKLLLTKSRTTESITQPVMTTGGHVNIPGADTFESGCV